MTNKTIKFSLFSVVFLGLFSKRNRQKHKENIFFVFLSSYRNTREGLGELEKAVETLAWGYLLHLGEIQAT